MTILYHTLRTIEIIVTLVVAVRLLTCPYEMRWHGKAAKIVFGVLWAMGALFQFANGFYFKHSGLEYMVVCGYVFIVILLFYRIPVLYALANNLMFWGIIDTIRSIVLAIVSNQAAAENINNYNMNFDRIHPLELLESIVMVGIMLYLAQRGKPMLSSSKKARCLAVIVLVLIGWYIMNYIVLPYDMVIEGENEKNMMLAVVALLLVICSCILYAIYADWIEEKRQRQLLRLKDSMLEEQIACLEENYELKRKQVHDGLQQNLLLKGYLAQGKIDEAYQYLENVQKGLKATQIKGETGITPIDIMLHYKKRQAEEQVVRIVTDIKVYFCPMNHNDVCILLGNLLDNAIEAAELEKEQREVHVKLLTVNQMFLLSIENEYQGKRRVREGEYLTTKQREGEHGIGLKSSRQIVEKYGGSFQIKDDGSIFRIEAIVLNTERKEEKENEEESGTETAECSRESVAGIAGNG